VRSLTKSRVSSWRQVLLGLTLFGVLALLVWPAPSPRNDTFVFYFPNSHRVVALEVIGNTKYLSVLQVLNMVGKLNGLQEKRNTLKLEFGQSHLELHADDQRVRIDKKITLLSAPVRISNGRWMVPMDFLTLVVPELTSLGVEYQGGTNRVFVGDVRPGSFTVRLSSISGGARLTFQFSSKVAVRTASMNGKWVMFLGEHPIEPLEPSFHFQNPYVSDVQFNDQDGQPKLVITPAATGLNFYPVLAEGGKVLQADVLKPATAQANALPPPAPPQAAAATAPPAPHPQPAQGTPSGAAPAAPANANADVTSGPPLPVVALDAGHGGDDSGAHSRDGVSEKDLDAQIVARVRLALLATGKYRVVVTRSGDVNLSFEQRTVAANVAGAIVFLTFHAGDLGGNSPRVAVYTYQPPSPPAILSGAETPPGFVAWNQIQETYLDRSRQLAQALQQRFTQIPGVTADAPTPAPVRALRSVNAPAVAIEIGSLASESDATPLVNPTFQEQLSTAVADVLAALPGGGF
jgi:N-acetylmuramoyl-L-alanine amidase